ncbi:MAG TPA: hypothetical protein VFJ97_11195 [Dermatophilaceae bacterium]|nr:hypothetical protein [Dermatophilaceae bacterium]
MTDTGDRSPLERAVDLFFYAPLGVMITARDEIPKLVAKGRDEAVAARFIGKMAVDIGKTKADVVVRQATEWLADRGLVPDPRRTQAEPAAPPTPAEPPPPPAEPPVPEADGPSSASLAIPGYDALSAPQVVQRLDGLSPDELESVRAYEAATRNRKTILSRIAQLQTG